MVDEIKDAYTRAVEQGLRAAENALKMKALQCVEIMQKELITLYTEGTQDETVKAKLEAVIGFCDFVFGTDLGG